MSVVGPFLVHYRRLQYIMLIIVLTRICIISLVTKAQQLSVPAVIVTVNYEGDRRTPMPMPSRL